MLSFGSAANGIIDTPAAIDAALLAASTGRSAHDCALVVLHLTMGHDDSAVLAAVRRRCPTARIVGCTCAGVIGKEGANESMHAVAVMMVWGEPQELAVATTAHMDGSNAAPAAAELARRLLADRPTRPQFVMLLASGIDIDCDGAIAGIESELGGETTIFGGTSADNMKGIASYQFLDDGVHDHAAALIGFFDPSLTVHTQASHGFVPLGVEMTVTAATGNRVHRLDGEPAWSVFTNRLGLTDAATPADTIPPGAVGEALSDAEAAEYGDSHLLRVITRRLPDGTLLMPTSAQPGTRLALMRRDEERIFRNLDVMMRQIRESIAGRDVVAVFHADCGARGRLTLDRVAKDEIVKAMQSPLFPNGNVGPWLGMYGFGEFARLGGRNRFHNYTTALYVVTR
ncbi:MAG: hypothetical protein RL398_2798 [Planctomycetota bacterium]|jgi:hypothetical protein